MTCISEQLSRAASGGFLCLVRSKEHSVTLGKPKFIFDGAQYKQNSIVIFLSRLLCGAVS